MFQPIPAITYNGERLQWLGPNLRYGILGSGRLRLALSASYRIGVYEEDDSPVLAGLGDRDDTLLAGLALQYEFPGGFDIEIVESGTPQRDQLDPEFRQHFQTGAVELVISAQDRVCQFNSASAILHPPRISVFDS